MKQLSVNGSDLPSGPKCTLRPQNHGWAGGRGAKGTVGTGSQAEMMVAGMQCVSGDLEPVPQFPFQCRRTEF